MVPQLVPVLDPRDWNTWSPPGWTPPSFVAAEPESSRFPGSYIYGSFRVTVCRGVEQSVVHKHTRLWDTRQKNKAMSDERHEATESSTDGIWVIKKKSNLKEL